MNTPFLLEIPPRGQIEEIGQRDRRHLVGYYGDPELSILAGHVAVIHRLESAVTDRDLDTRESRALGDLRSQTANMWAHGRAGQILIDSQRPFADQYAVPMVPEGYIWPKCEFCGCGIWPDGTGHHSAECVDQHAVCDASEVA